MAAKTTDPAPPAGNGDSIDRLAGLGDNKALAALRRQRGEVRQALQGCLDAVLGPLDAAPAPAVLDRALVHYRELRDRSHARRDQLRLTDSPEDAVVTGIVSTLDPALRGAAHRCRPVAGHRHGRRGAAAAGDVRS